jgi:hypothetical protein
MNNAKIFDIIKSDFGLLWKSKTLNNSIEIITPFETKTMKFISVFITKRNDTYIVSDGAWIYLNLYEIENDFDFKSFNKILSIKQIEYSIESTEDNNKNIFYYKKCKEDRLLSSVVFDLVNFILNSINIYTFQISDTIDEKQDSFRKMANKYLLTIDKDFKFNKKLDDLDIKFNAQYSVGCNIILIMYISGSNDYSFSSSIYKAGWNFELSSQSKLSQFIKYKIPLVDNSVNSFNDNINKNINFPHLEEKSGHSIVTWENKNKLKEYFEINR